MTSPDDHTTPTDPSTTDTAAEGPSLTRMLETWQAWNGREGFTRAAARAYADGDDETAARLRDMLARDRDVAALDALHAQHEMSSLLAGWEWHTVRAAREQGATWADIAHATRTDPEQARADYLDVIDRQETAATRYGGMAFDDAAEYRAAAGQWFEELHPDTPAHVVEEIEGAIVRGDVDELDALRGAWWNPSHVPAVTVFPAPTEAELAVASQAQDAAERGDDAEARRLMGIDDAQLAELLGAQAALPLHVQLAPGVAVPVGDREDGYRNHTVEDAVTALAPMLGSRTAAERAVAEYLGEHGPPVGPHPYGAVFEDADLIAIAYPTGVDPWAAVPGRVPHTHTAVRNRGNSGVAIDACDAEVDALDAAQDAADRAFQADIEADARVDHGGLGALEEPPAGARVRDSEGDVWRVGEGGWVLTGRADEDPGPHAADYVAQFAPLTALSQDPYADAVGEAREGWLVDPAVAAGHPDDDAVAAERAAAQEAILDAHYTADTERAARLQDRPWLAHGVTVDTAHVQISDDRAAPSVTDDRAWPVMPEWMREQARRSETDLADPSAVPARVDDAADIEARVAALREQITAREPPPPPEWESDRPVERPGCCIVVDTEQQEARREQLTRWHTDDTTHQDTHTDHDTDTYGEWDGDGALAGEPVIVTDDGPGLP